MQLAFDPWDEPHGDGDLPQVITQEIPPPPKDPDQFVYWDAYALRRDFLALKTFEDFWFFLQRSGPFRRQEIPQEKKLHGPERWCSTSLGELLSWQTFFERWQLEGWDNDDEPPYCDTAEESDSVTGFSRTVLVPAEVLSFDPLLTSPVIALTTCHSVVEAIAATIQADLLRRVRWRRCLDSECRKLFKYEDDRKLYCDHECAHAAGQRKRRHAARNARTLRTKTELVSGSAS